jgi:hypothetical protein
MKKLTKSELRIVDHEREIARLRLRVEELEAILNSKRYPAPRSKLFTNAIADNSAQRGVRAV